MDSPERPPAGTTSTFAADRLAAQATSVAGAAVRRRPHWVEDARRGLPALGCFLAYEDAGRHVLMPLPDGVTRIGRSVGAELRFEDTTVSRRHAVLARDPGRGVRLLDDRSLNGVQVNGTRVDSRSLHDGDEIRIGRHTLWFLDARPESPAPSPLEPALAAPSPS